MTGVEIAGLAASAIGAASSTANTISAGKANARGVEYAEKQGDINRQFQRDFWWMQNEYNSPKEQMKRLREAGINPHFYFGEGKVQNQASPAPSVPSSLMPNIRPADYSGFAQMSQIPLQVEMMKAQIDNINADTAKKTTEAEGQTLVNGMNTKTLANLDTDINLNNAIKGENIELTKAKVASEKQDLINAIDTNSNIKQTFENLVATKNYTEQQTANLITALALTKAQIVTEFTKQKNIIQDTKLKASQANYNNELAKTQPFVRSNLASQTAYNNQGTSNLSVIGQKLREDVKAAKRDNYIADKFALTNAETETFTAKDRQRVIQQTYKNLQQDYSFKELQITEKEWDVMVQQLTAPANIANPYLDTAEKATDVINPINSSTTTRFDNDGNYQGHTTTRRHR